MSSLVQRQSERQGIFLASLSPFERGAGGVKYQPYPLLTASLPAILGLNPSIQLKPISSFSNLPTGKNFSSSVSTSAEPQPHTSPPA